VAAVARVEAVTAAAMVVTREETTEAAERRAGRHTGSSATLAFHPPVLSPCPEARSKECRAVTQS
jgi:hypothetical protein